MTQDGSGHTAGGGISDTAPAGDSDTAKAASMRILHVPQAYPPVIGGGEVLAQRVSEGLTDLGHDVTVLTSSLAKMWIRRKDDCSMGQQVHKEDMGGVHVERFPETSFFHKWGRLLYTAPIPLRARWRRRVKSRSYGAFAQRVQTWIDTEKPDVVLTMMHNCPSVRAVAEAHQVRPFPLLISPQLHHDVPGWPVEEISGYLSRADAVTANTTYERDLLIAEYGVKAEQIIVTGGGTDLPPAAAPWPRAKRVLFVGRKHPDKRLDILVKAMEHVWPKHPDAELVLAGARSRRTNLIEQQVDALPEAWRAQVRSPDNIPEAEKIDLLGSSRCLVLPSETESFGLVLVEAWGYATPVITNDMPVFQATVAHDENGLLVPSRNPEALAGAICTMLEAPDRAKAMGHAGREEVARRHTWDAVSARYEEALRLAVTRAKARAST